MLMLLMAGAVGAQAPTASVVWRWKPGEGNCILQQQAQGGQTVELARVAGADETRIAWIDDNASPAPWKELSGVSVAFGSSPAVSANGALYPIGRRTGRGVSISMRGSAALKPMSLSSRIMLQHAAIGTIVIPFREAAAAVAALNRCETRFMREWGIDVDAWNALAVKPVPATPIASWFSPTDYPDREKIWKNDANVIARLSVGVDGGVRGCTVANRSAPIEYQQAACRALMKRARFRPALNARGEAVEAPYIAFIRFAAFQI